MIVLSKEDCFVKGSLFSQTAAVAIFATAAFFKDFKAPDAIKKIVENFVGGGILLSLCR